MSIHETMKQITEIAETLVVSGKVQGYVISEGQQKENKLCIIFHNDAPDKTELVLGDEFEIKVEDGKIFVVRKQPSYPKTYEECFNICFGDKHHIVQVVGLDDLGDNKELFVNFIKLKICRDAYWKIAGEQMGLGEPWKPDWIQATYTCTIICRSNNIVKDAGFDAENKILAFPTEEMRDAFYENFKDLIEECKELL